MIDINTGFNIEEALRYLSGETKGDVALVYEPKLPEHLRWHVECEFSDRRYIVPGTESGVAVRALMVAIAKWRNRNANRPFMGCWEKSLVN